MPKIVPRGLARLPGRAALPRQGLARRGPLTRSLKSPPPLGYVGGRAGLRACSSQMVARASNRSVLSARFRKRTVAEPVSAARGSDCWIVPKALAADGRLWHKACGGCAERPGRVSGVGSRPNDLTWGSRGGRPPVDGRRSSRMSPRIPFPKARQIWRDAPGGRSLPIKPGARARR